MNEGSSPRFGIGQSVARKEDPRLLKGRGCYTDDIVADGALAGWVVRSDVARGRLTGMNVAAARAMPGIHAIYTGADLERAGYGPINCGLGLKGVDGSAIRQPDRWALTRGPVTHVGEPLAFIVADTREQAMDAAEALAPEVEPQAPLLDPEYAVESAPIHATLDDNIALDWRSGDADATGALFDAAAHITRMRMVSNRVAIAQMEPRGALAAYENDRFILHVGSQGVHAMHQQLARIILKVQPERVRIVTRDVGGGFGMRIPAFPEYVCCLHAARDLGRPVRWRDDRQHSFVSDHAGRDAIFEAAMAFDREHRILAVQVKVIGNMGAYLGSFGPGVPTFVLANNLAGCYRIEQRLVETKCVFTNTTPTSAYRGAGRPEAIYIIERLIDRAARELGVDRIELRRRNMIRPEQLPFKAASGYTFDSGDFETILDRTLAKADYAGIRDRRRSATARGQLHGTGITCYLEATGGAPRELGGLRFAPDGRIEMVTGTLDYGQGHHSTFAQIIGERLGLPFEQIDLVQRDSDRISYGGGTGGSRSVIASSAALLAVSDKVVEKARRYAADRLEVAEADLSFERGTFAVAGTDRTLGFASLLAELTNEGRSSELDDELVIDAPGATFPNGCHIAEVEVDPETGQVRIIRYSCINDFGQLINPMLVQGQIHGGVVQAIGQAALEYLQYDGNGQPVSGSFMDYAMPRADDVPAIEVDFLSVPAKTNPLGVKGCGEAGVAGALPTIVNAVLDALAPLGIEEIDMPMTPERIWRAIRQADGRLAA